MIDGRSVPDWRQTTAMERFLWQTDPGGSSIVYRVEVVVGRPMDEARLSAAIAEVARMQPLLFSRLVPHESGIVWEPIRAPHEFSSEDVPVTRAELGRIAAIDLTKQVGLQVGLRDQPGGGQVLTLDYHHAAVDGQAGARCLGQILRCYGDQTRVRNFETFRRGSPKLSLRHSFPLPDDGRPIGTREGLRNLWVTIRGRSIRFSDSLVAAPVGQDTILTAVLSAEQSAVARLAIAGMPQPVNDIALAATFRCLAEDECLSDQAGRFMVMNPVDLRTMIHRDMPGVNMTGFAFPRRRRREIVRPEFADELFQELNYVRSRKVGAEFLRGIEAVQSRSRVLNFILARRWFDPAASLTCVTNLKPGRRFGCVKTDAGWRVGDHEIVAIRLTPPRPRGTALALALTESLGRYSLTMRGDPSIFTFPTMADRARNWFAKFGDLIGHRADAIQVDA